MRAALPSLLEFRGPWRRRRVSIATGNLLGSPGPRACCESSAARRRPLEPASVSRPGAADPRSPSFPTGHLSRSLPNKQLKLTGCARSLTAVRWADDMLNRIVSFALVALPVLWALRWLRRAIFAKDYAYAVKEAFGPGLGSPARMRIRERMPWLAAQTVDSWLPDFASVNARVNDLAQAGGPQKARVASSQVRPQKGLPVSSF